MSIDDHEEAVWSKRRHAHRPISYVAGEVLADNEKQHELTEQLHEDNIKHRGLMEQLHADNIESRNAAIAEQTRVTVDAIEDQSLAVQEMGLWTVREIQTQTEMLNATLDGQTSVIADGLRDASGRITGLTHSVDALHQSTREGFNDVVATLGIGFSALYYQTKGLVELSEKMVFALENPDQTRARESLSKGLHAYSNGWWDEARTEFETACDQFRYDPIGWLYRARLAFWRDGNTGTAHALIDDAIRYAEVRCSSHLSGTIFSL